MSDGIKRMYEDYDDAFNAAREAKKKMTKDDCLIKIIKTYKGMYDSADVASAKTKEWITVEDDDQVTTQEQWDEVYDSTTWGNTPGSTKKIPKGRTLLPATQLEVFAKEIMRELVECGKADFVLLKNDKLRTWWQEIVSEELAAQAKIDAANHKKMLKEQALSKLSDEEKEALGLNRKR